MKGQLSLLDTAALKRPSTPRDSSDRAHFAGRRFYGLPGTLRRALHSVNRSDWSLALHFLPVNLMHLAEIGKRDGHPLGDLAWHGPLLEVG